MAAGAALAQTNGSAKPINDGNRIHGLEPGEQLFVRYFKGIGPEQVATYVSSDAAGIVVRLPNGQKLKIPRELTRSVSRREQARYAVMFGEGDEPGVPGGGRAGRASGRTTTVYRAP